MSIRIPIQTWAAGIFVFGMACSCARSRDEGPSPSAAAVEEGVHTNRIVFKKPVRRAYGKPLELAKSDADIRTDEEPAAGASPGDEGPARGAGLGGRESSAAGASRYFSEVRAAQARREQAARAEKEDSLWILPRSPMMELGLSEDNPPEQMPQAIDSSKWGWMAEGIARLADDRRSREEAMDASPEDARVDEIIEQIAMERAARTRQPEAGASVQESVARPGEFRQYDTRSAAGTSSVAQVWGVRPAGPSAGDSSGEPPVSPWLASPASGDPEKEEEDGQQGSTIAGYYGLDTSQAGNEDAGGSMISKGMWNNAGWSGMGSMAPAESGSSATPEYGWPAPASAGGVGRRTQTPSAGQANSSWLTAPAYRASSASGPAPFQTSIQPIFTPKRPASPASPPSGVSIENKRPSAPNYLDPTAPRR